MEALIDGMSAVTALWNKQAAVSGGNMKRVIVNRIEGAYAVCETVTTWMVEIRLADLPKGIKVGDVLLLIEGEYFLYSE